MRKEIENKTKTYTYMKIHTRRHTLWSPLEISDREAEKKKEGKEERTVESKEVKEARLFFFPSSSARFPSCVNLLAHFFSAFRISAGRVLHKPLCSSNSGVLKA